MEPHRGIPDGSGRCGALRGRRQEHLDTPVPGRSWCREPSSVWGRLYLCRDGSGKLSPIFRGHPRFEAPGPHAPPPPPPVLAAGFPPLVSAQ